MHYLGEVIETYTIPGLISMKWDEITESPDSLGRVVGRIAPDIILAVIAKNMEMEAKANAGKKVYKGKINSVDDIIKGVENGDIPLTNNIRKGNYGEMKMDSYFDSRGYERISLDRVTDIDAPTHQGIDGVYYNPDGHSPYIIGEAKYGSSKLGSTRDGMQMSGTWINGSDRLVNAVGKDIADDILLEGYGKKLVNVAPDGTLKLTDLD